MGLYVVTLRFPDAFDEEFVALIPRHRAFINNLIEENIILSYAISEAAAKAKATRRLLDPRRGHAPTTTPVATVAYLDH